MICITLSKQQALDANPESIQQVNFTGNLVQAGNTTIIFNIEEKTTHLSFSKGIMIVLRIYFTLI